jgi:hypothetical protein
VSKLLTLILSQFSLNLLRDLLGWWFIEVITPLILRFLKNNPLKIETDDSVVVNLRSPDEHKENRYL